MATDDKSKGNNLIVGGYEFMTEIDAQKGAMDLNKIKLLNTRAKATRPQDIKAVYEKAIENKIFKTPLGWGYLANLRAKLIESGYKEDDLIPIPLGVTITRHSAMENLSVRQRIKPEKKKNSLEFKRVFPIVLSAILTILVIVMFLITVTSESDNIINYRRNVTNRYASWEQDLKEREKKVREAEKRLGIEDTSSYYEDTDSN
ncbi:MULTISPECIES: hypothetical protein [unclassified Butyrivibrio]|uniref:hypothetical protein n=1 Tax=unclassified Butyrivibrio TaxID=2639466 RepID=UPI0003B311BE|nr:MULTISPECIES: hypothetical protein [unclassified Butyrivibrio]MDC7292820.1 hypothetical protein [Butyrivibrio sp. DSM 10294]